MATNGTFGNKLVFSTSDRRILTFRNMVRSISGRYGIHETVGKRPQPEFLGPDLQQVTFSMDFYLGLGVEPRDMLEVVQKAVESGYCGKLIIGGRQVGKNRWTITKSQENWTHVSNTGVLIFASVDVTMQEYI